MEPQPKPDTKVCKYFMNGNCSAGAKCHYQHVVLSNESSHDSLQQGSEGKDSQRICKFFQSKGTCNYGNKCSYRHVLKGSDHKGHHAESKISESNMQKNTGNISPQEPNEDKPRSEYQEIIMGSRQQCGTCKLVKEMVQLYCGCRSLCFACASGLAPACGAVHPFSGFMA